MSTWLLASHEFNSLLSNIILENFSSQKHQNEFTSPSQRQVGMAK